MTQVQLFDYLFEDPARANSLAREFQTILDEMIAMHDEILNRQK